MVSRVIRGSVAVVLTSLILTGCGRQVARDPVHDPDLPATGPGPGYTSVPRPFVAASIGATGGLSAWARCNRLEFDAIVTAHQPGSGVYLTEHHFIVRPWSDAVWLTAREPRARLTCQVVCGQCSHEGYPDSDVSSLHGSYCRYAEAVLHIVTVPVRMLENNVELTRQAVPVQIVGRWYQPIDARFKPQEIISERKGRRQATVVEPYWTEGTYFQDYTTSAVDLVWLGNPLAQEFLLVRGYDYEKVADGVLIPTKIEVYDSNAEAGFGPCLFHLDLRL